MTTGSTSDPPSVQTSKRSSVTPDGKMKFRLISELNQTVTMDNRGSRQKDHGCANFNWGCVSSWQCQIKLQITFAIKCESSEFLSLRMQMGFHLVGILVLCHSTQIWWLLRNHFTLVHRHILNLNILGKSKPIFSFFFNSMTKYFDYKDKHLPVCKYTVYYLLHLTQDIRNWGPVSNY